MKLFLTAIILLNLTHAFAMENPAAKFCAEVGGESSIYGFCSFGKSSISEWTLFLRVKNNIDSQAIVHYCKARNLTLADPNGMIANPASQYCVGVGGKSEMKMSDAGEVGVCSFSDYSWIEEWTLYFGNTERNDPRLGQLLGCHWK
jgi:putative hemolysin